MAVVDAAASASEDRGSPGPATPQSDPSGPDGPRTDGPTTLRPATDQSTADEPARRGAPASAVPVAAVAAALFALIAARPLTDNSLLTHLATGRLIVESGVPATNPFLYTSTDFPVPSWWWSILLAVADRLGGAGAIRLMAAVFAAMLGALLVRLARSADRSSPAAPNGDGTRCAGSRPGVHSDVEPLGLLAVVVPVALAAVCVLPFLNGRPHLGGFVLLAAALVARAERRSPWWLVAVFAIWVNIHGTWAYGLAVLGAFAVAAAIDERRIRRDDVRALLAGVVGLVAGAALYPERFALIVLPTRQFGDPIEREALRAYAEWSPVAPDMAGFWMLVALGVCALAGAARRRSWGAGLLAVGLVVLGMSAARVLPIAAISLVPLAAAGLGGIGSLSLPTGRPARLTTVGAGILAVVVVVFAVSAPGYRFDRYPVAAIDWLEERDLVANGTNVVSHDYVGNYLEWRYGDRAHAYVDDRPSAETLIDYRDLLQLEDGWQEAFERAQPDVVLWQREEPLSAELAADDAWFDAGDSGRFAVFCRVELVARCS